ncbi:hypothetical protein CFC21_058440 [Triticum aestivum]|uniref:Uncharacterized protein n=3 Tax=Triticum TaxID=4564 RepID=A0A9R0WE24_TRITD|nr:hypothetical protein CFC21_058440 [Triticum aestivum]VAI08359.1 unnamed protein product [Triticum turgidum subsp. durum]
MCLIGWATSPPPACATNSAGVRKLPWHTHTILTSSALLYWYRKPSILSPLRSPLVYTTGIFRTMSATLLVLVALAAGHSEPSFCSPMEMPGAAALTANAEDEEVATALLFAPTDEGRTADDRLRPRVPGVPVRLHTNIYLSNQQKQI